MYIKKMVYYMEFTIALLPLLRSIILTVFCYRLGLIKIISKNCNLNVSFYVFLVIMSI